MSAPLPVPKGLFQEIKTGRRVHGLFLKHNPDAAETVADDCFITISEKFEGAEHNCGESGIYPVDQFKAQFRFLEPPREMGSFGKKPA